MATILVVDDEVTLRRVLVRFLRKEDHDVLEAADGIEALALTGGLVIDVAFIDVMMPRMDGLTLMRRMLQDHPGVRLVVMSAFEDVIDLPERELGLVQTLKKPFGLDEIKAALEAVLNRQRHLSGGLEQ